MDLLVTDPVSGRVTGLARTVRRALKALHASRARFSIVGATALSVRGLPRMTRDLDVVVPVDEAWSAVDSLVSSGFRSLRPVRRNEEPEAMYVFVDRETRVEVDLLVAAGEPEMTVLEHASRKKVFGVLAPVARLEHLLLMYLYSNEPKHLGDFVSIVRSGRADLVKTQRLLGEIHPQMLPELRQRIRVARTPPPPPPRPPRRQPS